MFFSNPASHVRIFPFLYKATFSRNVHQFPICLPWCYYFLSINWTIQVERTFFLTKQRKRMYLCLDKHKGKITYSRFKRGVIFFIFIVQFTFLLLFILLTVLHFFSLLCNIYSLFCYFIIIFAPHLKILL